MAKYSGMGWHKQSIRHSNARKYGKAGGTYAVIGQAYSRHTGMPIGKERTEIINTKTNVLFQKAKNEKDVKHRFESFWNNLNPNSNEIVKVKDISIVKSKKHYGTAKRKHTTRGELYDKVRDELYDGYDSGDVPEYLTIKNKNKIIIKAEEWEGAGVKDIEITPEDVIRYYDTQARNITSGIRTLAGFSTDWRMVDNMAKESLEIFKVMNPEKLRTLARKHDMTAKF